MPQPQSCPKGAGQVCGFSAQLPGGCTLHAAAKCAGRRLSMAAWRWQPCCSPRIRQAGRRRIGGPFRNVDSEWISLSFFYHETWGCVCVCGDIRGHMGDSSLLSGSCSVPRLSSTLVICARPCARRATSFILITYKA